MPLSSHTCFSKARRLFAEHGGLLRATEAIRLGIHPRDLYSLRDHGEVEELARGLSRLASAPPLTSPDLVSVAVRAPKAVTCLISALMRHGLTTEVPQPSILLCPATLRCRRSGTFRYACSGTRSRRSVRGWKLLRSTASPYAFTLPKKPSPIVSSIGTKLDWTWPFKLYAPTESGKVVRTLRHSRISLRSIECSG